VTRPVGLAGLVAARRQAEMGAQARDRVTRLGSSTAAKVRAVTGPTPGTLIRGRQTGWLGTAASTNR
jgi:hypothetical protein